MLRACSSLKQVGKDVISSNESNIVFIPTAARAYVSLLTQALHFQVDEIHIQVSC